METFVIEVQEILSRKISVEAENLDGAISKVKEDYRKEEIVLDADDFLEVDFSPYLDHSRIDDILQRKYEDPRTKLSEILCLIGIPKEKSNLIAAEAGSTQCIVDEEYLFELKIKSYFIKEAIKYIDMFYKGEL